MKALAILGEKSFKRCGARQMRMGWMKSLKASFKQRGGSFGVIRKSLKKPGMTAALLVLATVLLLLSSVPMTARAEDPVKVIVNGKNVIFPDVQPYIDANGRIIVPVRFVSEALGCKVEWHGETQTVSFSRGMIRAELTIGKKEITVMEVKKTMDTIAVLQTGRTLVPMRFVAEAFGCKVSWEAKTRTATIIDSGKDTYMVGAFSIYLEAGDDTFRNTDGGFGVVKKSGLILGDSTGIGGRPVFLIDIKVDLPETDIPKQRQEVREILNQQLSSKVVNEIMAYSEKKTDRFERLELKEWNDGKYNIVISGGIGPIAITIYTQ